MAAKYIIRANQIAILSLGAFIIIATEKLHVATKMLKTAHILLTVSLLPFR